MPGELAGTQNFELRLKIGKRTALPPLVRNRRLDFKSRSLAITRRIPELEYVFKHELARDAAYATILNRRRSEFHLLVAEAMEKLFSDRLEENAHRLARHFELGGDQKRALQYYEMAGAVATAIHAKEEGVAHYSKALAAAESIGAADDVIGRLAAKRGALEQTAAAADLY